MKCQLLGRAALSIADPPFDVASGGVKIMGAPTGTPQYRRVQSQRVNDDATSSLPAMRSIELWSAWSLLKHCVTSRVSYLSRVVEPEFCLGALAEFDRKVDEMVYFMAGGVGIEGSHSSQLLKDRVDVLRSLPLGLGGLGITRLAGLAGEQACLLSRTLTYEFIERYCPELAAGVRVSWRPVVLGETEDRTRAEGDEQRGVGIILATGEPSIPPTAVLSEIPFDERRAQRRGLRVLPSVATAEETLDGDELTPAGRSVRAKVRAIHQRRCSDLIDTMRSNDEQTLSDWLKFSCFKGSGHWLAGSGGHFYGRFAFRLSSEYRAALRMRLLLPLASSDVVHGGAVLCRCGKTIDLSTAPLHPIDCMNSQWHWIKRHNDTRDLLRDFLKAQSNLDLHKIMLEPEVTTPGGEPVHTTGAQMPAQRAGVTSVAAWREHRHGDGVIRADLGRFSVHNKQYFDVAVVDPTAVSYRVAEQEHLGGDVGDGMTAAAALEGENARGVLGGADRATADSAAGKTTKSCITGQHLVTWWTILTDWSSLWWRLLEG
jgi:hypothetical protein